MVDRDKDAKRLELFKFCAIKSEPVSTFITTVLQNIYVITYTDASTIYISKQKVS